jgi:hypothetical protein
MANAKTKTPKTKTPKKATKAANKPTDQQVAAQAAAATLLAAMQAKHASKAPSGKGPRHGRHAKARMPSPRSVKNFANAVLTAIAANSYTNSACDRQYVVVRGLHAPNWRAFGHTWLKNQHGWRVDQTCQRSANVLGFTGKSYQQSTVDRHVVLTPLDPAAFAKDPAGYVKANLANVVAPTL